MRIRLSIRTALIAVALLASAFAWYANNVASRAAEIRALARIENLTRNSTSVSDISNATSNWCGSWAGGVVYTEQRGPALIRWLDLDAFRRVTRIKFQHEHNPDLVVELGAFRQLQFVSFTYGTSTPLSQRSQTSAELAGALYLFRSLHPEIDVRYDDSESTAYHLSQTNPNAILAGPFGDVFGGSDSDSLEDEADDPFGRGAIVSSDPFTDTPATSNPSE